MAILKIIGILAIVFGVIYIISLVTTGDSEEAASNAVTGTAGCLVTIFQISLFLMLLGVILGLFSWIFS